MNAHISETSHSILVTASWFMRGEGAVLLAGALWLYAFGPGSLLTAAI